MNEDILSKIIEWGRKSPEVRALILEGPRAERDKSDELSDYDVDVFTTKSRPFTEDNSWLSSIGDLWVCIPAVVEHNGKTFASRLVIFRNGVKADFILYPVSVLQEFAKVDHCQTSMILGIRCFSIRMV